MKGRTLQLTKNIFKNTFSEGNKDFRGNPKFSGFSGSNFEKLTCAAWLIEVCRVAAAVVKLAFGIQPLIVMQKLFAPTIGNQKTAAFKTTAAIITPIQ